jgi:hypothetical protein
MSSACSSFSAVLHDIGWTTLGNSPERVLGSESARPKHISMALVGPGPASPSRFARCALSLFRGFAPRSLRSLPENRSRDFPSGVRSMSSRTALKRSMAFNAMERRFRGAPR